MSMKALWVHYAEHAKCVENATVTQTAVPRQSNILDEMWDHPDEI